jgi:cell division protein FtsB
MSPFSNLFQKQVGNLNERYKLAEATFDTLLDKFSEINDVMSRVKQTAELDDAQVKIAALAARNEHLEAENNELKLKLKLSNSINSVKEPARQDNFAVIEAKIAALAANNERLESEVNQLKLSKSIPVECTCCWSGFPIDYDEGETMIHTNTHVRKSVRKKSFSKYQESCLEDRKKMKSLNEKNDLTSDSLNIVEVGRQFKKLLDAYNIDYYTFAKSQLQTTKTVLNQLMSKPKSWADLTIKEKNKYRRMQK